MSRPATMQRSGATDVVIRPAADSDLPACENIWRLAIDAYSIPLGLPPLPTENPGLRRLHAHTRSTDPDRFLVAERREREGPRIVAFGSAVDRHPLWFLSMLFVLPGEQARGLGRAMLRRLLPESTDDRVLATCTDSAQPISNGLYAALGIAPRMPLFNLVGRPRPGAWLPPLPDGVRAEAVADPAAWRDSAEVAGMDRELLGYVHPEDHRFVVGQERRPFAYRDAAGRLLGYGYTGEIGRMGPIAVTDPALLAPVVAHLLTTVEPRGASAVWLPGAAGPAIAAAVRSGLRIEGFPTLVCWSRPFADFSRYVPTSPGLI